MKWVEVATTVEGLLRRIAMIFDIARHKFSEGLITLMFFALVSLFVALFAPDLVVTEGGAPLRGFIDFFAINHPVASALLMFPMVIYSGLRFARAAVRVALYSASSLGLLALGGVAIFATTASTGYMNLMIVALLVSELLGRLLYCFGANMRMSYLFTAMLALGIMPLVDGALVPVALALPVVVIAVRGTLREAIITIVGVAFPTFVYCYLVWLMGGEFNDAFVAIWREGGAFVAHDALFSYLTLPRLIFLGITLFLGVCSLISYYGVRVTLVDSARVIWRLLIALQLMLIAMLLLMPCASPAVVVVLVLIITLMLPQLFIRVDVITATFAYLIWVVSALGILF